MVGNPIHILACRDNAEIFRCPDAFICAYNKYIYLIPALKPVAYFIPSHNTGVLFPISLRTDSVHKVRSNPYFTNPRYEHYLFTSAIAIVLLPLPTLPPSIMLNAKILSTHNSRKCTPTTTALASIRIYTHALLQSYNFVTRRSPSQHRRFQRTIMA